MKFALIAASVVFAGLVGVALAGAAPESAESCSCHGAPVKASCHGEEAGCHGRSTMLQRRAARQEERIEARQAARCARAEARSCHGASSCHGDPAPVCSGSSCPCN